MRTRMLIKGIGLGVLAGTVIAAAVIPSEKKCATRSRAGKVMKTLEHVVEGIGNAFM